MYVLTAWATLAATAVYLWTGINAARARQKFKVMAPAMDGPPAFLCAQRVQANTLEQLPVLLGPMWVCALFLGDAWAAGVGALWCVGRVLYALAYYKAPEGRATGFTIAITASLLAFGGAIVGLLMR